MKELALKYGCNPNQNLRAYTWKKANSLSKYSTAVPATSISSMLSTHGSSSRN